MRSGGRKLRDIGGYDFGFDLGWGGGMLTICATLVVIEEISPETTVWCLGVGVSYGVFWIAWAFMKLAAKRDKHRSKR